MKRPSVKQVSKSTHYVIAVILVLSLILNFVQFSYTSAPYRELQTKYDEMQIKYDNLSNQYEALSQEYAQLKQVALAPPYASISSGSIKWVFYDLEMNVITWTMKMDTYRSYVTKEKPKSLLYLKATEGSIKTYDVRPYIQPSFFKNIIGTLTSGRSDKDFVREVDNVKNQITVYDISLGDAPYQFSAETLTEGSGMCADTTILMASMLMEGNRQANYGFHVYVWYVYLNDDGTIADNPATLNHVIVEVNFQGGEHWYIETTGKRFSTYSQDFEGWRYEVTSIGG